MTAASGTDDWRAQAPSQPTVRVVEILEHLARFPDRSFGASELARALDLTKSTCLAILSTLTDAGYLIQHPKRKDYRLGPATVALGRSAQEVLPDLRPARATLQALATTVDAVVNVTAVLEDQLVILDVMGPANPFGGVLRLGVRVPLTAPYGAVHVAWSTSDHWNQWVRSAPGRPGDAVEKDLRRVIESGRARGYLVTIDLPPGHELEAVQNRMRGLVRRVDADDFAALARARLAESAYFLEDYDLDGRYQVGQIQVPVLEPVGAPRLALAANFMGHEISGQRLRDVADRLMAAAAEVAEHLA